VMADVAEPVQQDIRIIPVYRQPTQVEGVAEVDLRHFVIDAYRTGCWQQRRWLGRRMPSGRRCDKAYHGAMLNVLRKAGILANSRARATGYLAVDLAEALRRLGFN